MTEPLLKTITADHMPRDRQDPVDGETLKAARSIVEDVKKRGESALRDYAERFGDMEPGAPLVFSRAELAAALEEIAPKQRALLERTAERIRTFAKAQADSLKNVEIPIQGGRAGQEVAPVERAGCYAPGGRFPLPSSVLMTAVTARAAGVDEVWVASPKPVPITLAAAAVAGADGLLAVGGAQGIAALAYGVGPVPACDTIVGPGNRFVTAAKQLVFGRVGIDMLAGPSELAVLADDTADPATVAADLLGQAEHDPDAVPVLITTDAALIESVNKELAIQLAELSTADTAVQALKNGFAIFAKDIESGAALCDRIAPEHLELHVADPSAVSQYVNHYGALFVGAGAAEVLGDYGAGPNHTLPTGGTARHSGGLSVFDFMRIRTWMKIDDLPGARQLVEDARDLACLEGLTGHARSAMRRL
jgi:histidinol dehydrogenase